MVGVAFPHVCNRATSGSLASQLDFVHNCNTLCSRCQASDVVPCFAWDQTAARLALLLCSGFKSLKAGPARCNHARCPTSFLDVVCGGKARANDTMSFGFCHWPTAPHVHPTNCAIPDPPPSARQMVKRARKHRVVDLLDELKCLIGRLAHRVRDLQ